MEWKNPETVYFDANDDIASVIESVKATKTNLVALVVPKRSDVLRNTVNLKLLKSVCRQNEKKIGLITTDQTTIDLAARVGLAVSPNLKQPPLLPTVKAAPASDQPTQITAAEPARPPKRRRGAVGWNNKLRSGSTSGWARQIRWGLFAVGLFLLGLSVSFLALPQSEATIKLTTEATTLATTVEAVLDRQIDQIDTDSEVYQLPLVEKKLQVELKTAISPTGRRTIGDYATGRLTVINCTDEKLNLPVRSRVTRGGFSFVSLTAVSLGPNRRDDCGVYPSASGEVRIRAAQPGAEYNLAPGDYQLENLARADYQAYGGEISGGSSREIEFITEEDRRLAEDRLKQDRDDSAALADLLEEMTAAGLFSLTETKNVLESEPSLNDDQDQMTRMIEYSYLALTIADLERLVEPSILPERSASVAIVDYGFATATYSLEPIVETGAAPGSLVNYRLRLSLYDTLISHQFDSAALAKAIAGQPADQAAASIRRMPGVATVEVDLRPFWVDRIPEDLDRIRVTVVSANDDRSND